ADASTAAPVLSRSSALFLDFDGTLADLAPHPDAVQPADDLVDVLTALARSLDGALAIITGRRLESLDRHLSPLLPIGVGLHGSQFRWQPGATPEDLPAVPQIDPLAARLREAFAADPRIWVEHK